MSGPIIRKYGFPNFENIFGARPLEHGADKPENEQSPESKSPKETEQPAKDVTGKKKS